MVTFQELLEKTYASMGAARDPWKQFPKKPQPQQGLPKEGPSSRLPNRVLPPAGGTIANKPTGFASRVAASKPNNYRPGATVRATGPNMDKFPQLQRFVDQPKNILQQVSKVGALARSLATGSRLGIAGAVMAPTPTADATLKGALKRGDYKPTQGPKNPDEGLTRAQSFDKAFKSARESGKSGFEWRGKTYTTKVKGQ